MEGRATQARACPTTQGNLPLGPCSGCMRTEMKLSGLLSLCPHSSPLWTHCHQRLLPLRSCHLPGISSWPQVLRLGSVYTLCIGFLGCHTNPPQTRGFKTTEMYARIVLVARGPTTAVERASSIGESLPLLGFLQLYAFPGFRSQKDHQALPPPVVFSPLHCKDLEPTQTITPSRLPFQIGSHSWVPGITGWTELWGFYHSIHYPSKTGLPSHPTPPTAPFPHLSDGSFCRELAQH